MIFRLFIVLVTFSMLLFAVDLSAQSVLTSTCYGTTQNGKIENSVQLPESGPNFSAYSSLGVMTGRTYVHSKVVEAVVNTYKVLAQAHPDKKFIYGETGFKDGGKFWPHKTHQNGLSVDFFVPVVNQKNESVLLPTSALNKFGYSIEFDKKGNYKEYKIDYETMAAHLASLYKEAQKAGIGITRVIFDPDMQPDLFKTKDGELIKAKMTFSKNQAWVRHDEHYHVDFDIPCTPMAKQ